MMITTNRLKLIPLTSEQLIKYLCNDNSLEFDLGLNISHRSVSDDLKEAIEKTIIPSVILSGDNYYLKTLWTAISKDENKMVADLCFFGEVDEIGVIEIGYGTYDEFQGKGFMTEMVEGIIKWINHNTSINIIIATTNKENIASIRILDKNNFIIYEETDFEYKWKLIIK